MNQIVAVYKANECPQILNPVVRRRMAEAAAEWDEECSGYFIANAGTPVEFVIECPPSLLPQKEKLVRVVDRAMRAP